MSRYEIPKNLYSLFRRFVLKTVIFSSYSATTRTDNGKVWSDEKAPKEDCDPLRLCGVISLEDDKCGKL